MLAIRRHVPHAAVAAVGRVALPAHGHMTYGMTSCIGLVRKDV